MSLLLNKIITLLESHGIRKLYNPILPCFRRENSRHPHHHKKANAPCKHLLPLDCYMQLDTPAKETLKNKYYISFTTTPMTRTTR
ncbi:hypothetical protein DA2_2153 [Desulfovibrio sp. A2]|nr:hypothetical protein DA2_2153 [Desulfovibrio sp. A2]